MKIILTTGGTGGHIYPAISLANELMKDNPKNEILFIGNNDRMETYIVPKSGYRFIGISAPRFNDSSNKLKALVKLRKAYKESIGLVSQFNPDIIIGFGSYVSVPVLLAGKKLGIKTLIHEQNSIPGLANKSISHFVNKIVCAYEDASLFFNKNKTVVLGNPRESAVKDFVKDKGVLKQFGFKNNKYKTILCVMGSLGAKTVNDMMVEILNRMKEEKYNVIYVTGKNNYEQFINNFENIDNIKIVDYIDQFTIAGNCDLVISRGGATSCCEYMALGLPSIIIPSPFVPNNHQYYNAKSMFNNGASTFILQKNIKTDEFIKFVNDIIFNDDLLKLMSDKAKEMSHPECGIEMVKLVNNLVNENGK